MYKNQYKWPVLSETHKSCSSCGQVLPHDNFAKAENYSIKFSGGMTSMCRSCTNERGREYYKKRIAAGTYKKYKYDRREYYFRKKYGLSVKEYEEILVAQNSKCAICLVKLQARGSGTHLDHCHKTGNIRAFLCTNCNRGLGHFKDSIESLESAITYLKAHNSSDA